MPKIDKVIKLFFKVRKHRGKNNLIESNKSGFIKCKFIFKGNHNKIQSHDSLFYNCKFRFYGSNNIVKIGAKCSFKNVEFWFEGDNNIITIGEQCSFCGKTQIACLEGTKISIGDNLLSSSDVFLRTSDSHSVLDLEGNRINFAKNIYIGNNVWLCQKTTLLKGSKVSDNSIVAYGSIVTKKFDEPHCIIGGNPAKIIKREIDWKPER